MTGAIGWQRTDARTLLHELTSTNKVPLEKIFLSKNEWGPVLNAEYMEQQTQEVVLKYNKVTFKSKDVKKLIRDFIVVVQRTQDIFTMDYAEIFRWIVQMTQNAMEKILGQKVSEKGVSLIQERVARALRMEEDEQTDPSHFRQLVTSAQTLLNQSIQSVFEVKDIPQLIQCCMNTFRYTQEVFHVNKINYATFINGMAYHVFLSFSQKNQDEVMRLYITQGVKATFLQR